MNRVGVNAIFSFAHSSDEDVEIEVLQADVMRFMAILGFILTIIFALVQSLPFSPKNSRPTAEQKELLSTDITVLKRYVQGQLAVLKNLRQEIELAEELKEVALTKAQNATRNREQMLSETALVKSALDESHKRLELTDSQIKRQTRSLRMIRLQTEEERRQLELLQSRVNQLLQSANTAVESRNKATTEISNAQQPADRSEPIKNRDTRAARIQAKLSRIQNQRQIGTNKLEKKTPASRARIPSPKSADAKATQVPRRKGFTLKFESDPAFDRLLKTKAIKFFAMIGKKAWQARLAVSGPSFISDRRPPRYYQMDSVTVPEHYIVAFRRIVAAHQRDTVVWGVVLPDQMISKVNKQITGKIGGDVVIAADATIRMENANP